MGNLRIIPVVLSSVLLSGCFLPPQLTLASWALDGLSVMFTKKSITDHGISAVAQKDCALWRGFTEGAVCRSDDSINALADAGDIDLEGNPAITSSLAGTDVKKSVDLFNRSIFSDLAFKDHSYDETVSWQNHAVTEVASVSVQITTVKSVDVEQLTALKSPVLEIEVTEEKPPQQVAEVSDVAETNTLQGNYLVIGSFSKWANATRFAEWYEDLGAEIVSANVDDTKVFRILVGPYTADNQESVVASVINSGIEDAWGMNVESQTMAMNWKQDELIQVVSVPQ